MYHRMVFHMIGHKKGNANEKPVECMHESKSEVGISIIDIPATFFEKDNRLFVRTISIFILFLKK